MDELLLLLLKHNAHQKAVSLSTTIIGEALSMSQQNASRQVRLLIEGGLIEKKEEGLMLTSKGLALAKREFVLLQTVFEPKQLILEGTIIDGLGEGKYYLSLKPYCEQIEKKLGFWPYPGTLNLKLSKDQMENRAVLMTKDPLTIEGFKTPDRTYGGLFAYPCLIEGVKGALIIPIRTHHGTEVVELIAPIHLRDKFGKKAGDTIRVVFE